MSENVKPETDANRYGFSCNYPGAVFIERPDGEWEPHEVAESLRSQLQAAQESNGLNEIEIRDLKTRLESADLALAAAEERADRAEKRSQFNKGNHLAAEKEIDRLTAELSTLRRESVRVDVLLRWTESRSRVLSILGGAIMSRAGSNPGEQAKALLSWLTAILDRRQSRSTTNTKGIDSTRRAEEGK